MASAVFPKPKDGASTRKPSPRPSKQSPDPEGLAEFSVVYTNRALNHMSKKFQQAMREISATLKRVYNAQGVALVPGGGTYTMEAVAHQFGAGQKCLVLRNGYFSFRWSQIFEMGSIPSEEIVLKARPVEEGPNPCYAPCPLDEVVQTILREKPNVVFAPHVETASGIILPDAYMKEVAEAVHAVGGFFVLDCIASGCIWVDMKAIGIDILLTAPQKSWSSSAGVGLLMLSPAARTHLDATKSSIFALDLKKWVAVMEAYENGGHMYHATMPTDAIMRLSETQHEMEAYGLDKMRRQQWELGAAVRRLLAQEGFKSVAAQGFGAPGVVVSYTADPEVKSGSKFAALGMQTAAGVPLMLDEFTSTSSDFQTFRLGLFGIDKLRKTPATVSFVEQTLRSLASPEATNASRL